MCKFLIEIVNLLAIAMVLSFPFFKLKGRGIIALGVITVQVLLNSIAAVYVFFHGCYTYEYDGSQITGIIPVRIDFLSAWFIIIISFTFITGAWYGFQYLKQYKNQADNIALHAVAYILVYTSLIDICVVQNGIVFLVLWEIMAVGCFITIIFEHYKTETLKAGINFLIQSHIGILFLMMGFMWSKIKTGSFDFEAISSFSSNQPALLNMVLFLFFFFGFAIKAGFVPFHTWLPLAHPVAPAHISGIMSGVIIKIGIYGIFRVLLLLKTDMISIGYFILFISVITGIYGVMLAIVQHNLKKLLAYHSIENIGIIGIGIGLGCLGLGYHNQFLMITGLGGALLHTLNHSLFKSLLFYCAGNVYQAKHTMNIEALGGIIKQMPRTSFLFLIGSLAICGLPPFNGFVSEFFIYNGLFNSQMSDSFLFILVILFTILGLVLIGGFALICFTKAFGIVFLGTPREKVNNEIIVEDAFKMTPIYIIALVILLIGLFPLLLNPALIQIIHLYQPVIYPTAFMHFRNLLYQLTVVGWYSFGFIVFTLLLFLIRHLILSTKTIKGDNTWGCGYVGETSKMQYSASSYIRTYRKLTEPLLLLKKEKREISGIYPDVVYHKTFPGDKLENLIIDKPLYFIRRLLNRFVFLQNGNIQSYILYGFIFVGLAILIPFFIDKIETLIHLFNQL